MDRWFASHLGIDLFATCANYGCLVKALWKGQMAKPSIQGPEEEKEPLEGFQASISLAGGEATPLQTSSWQPHSTHSSFQLRYTSIKDIYFIFIKSSLFLEIRTKVKRNNLMLLRDLEPNPETKY